MSMRSPIPPAIREQLAEDPFMKSCLFEGIMGAGCRGRIEWHHAFKYAGKRMNAIWSILPLCHYHHYHEAIIQTPIREQLRRRIIHFGEEENFRSKYPKSDLFSPPEKKKGGKGKI